MIRFAPKLSSFIENHLPERLLKALNNYSSSTQNIRAESDWKQVMKSYLNIILTNGIILLALMLLTTNFFIPFLNKNIENPIARSIVGLVVSFAIAAPFLWALMTQKPQNIAYKRLWLDKKYSRGPLLVIELFRSGIGIVLIVFMVDRLFSGKVAILVAAPIMVVVLILFSKKIQKVYQRLEGRFLTNLNAREKNEARKIKKAAVHQKQFNPQSDLSPWDAHMVDLEVNPHAEYIGKTLVELSWREQFGINIAYIKRGEKLIYAPGRNNRILPFDRLGIIATDEQINLFKPIFDAEEKIDEKENDIDDIILQKIVVDKHNKLKGQSIRGSHIRERTKGLVVGIERNKERLLNPDSTTCFEWGDIVWIVGERNKILELNNGGKVVSQEV